MAAVFNVSLVIGFPGRVRRLGWVVLRSRTLKLAMKLWVQLAEITTCDQERFLFPHYALFAPSCTANALLCKICCTSLRDLLNDTLLRKKEMKNQQPVEFKRRHLNYVAWNLPQCCNQYSKRTIGNSHMKIQFLENKIDDTIIWVCFVPSAFSSKLG